VVKGLSGSLGDEPLAKGAIICVKRLLMSSIMGSRITFYSMRKKLGYGYDIPLFGLVFYILGF
jgi:hypothetical protein